MKPVWHWEMVICHEFANCICWLLSKSASPPNMFHYLATQSHFYRTEASIKSDLNVSHIVHSSTLNSHSVIKKKCITSPNTTCSLSKVCPACCSIPARVDQQPHTGSVVIKDGWMDGQLACIFKRRNL